MRGEHVRVFVAQKVHQSALLRQKGTLLSARVSFPTKNRSFRGNACARWWRTKGDDVFEEVSCTISNGLGSLGVFSGVWRISVRKNVLEAGIRYSSALDSALYSKR